MVKIIPLLIYRLGGIFQQKKMTYTCGLPNSYCYEYNLCLSGDSTPLGQEKNVVEMLILVYVDTPNVP